jgi:two-component system cell cycle response regulator
VLREFAKRMRRNTRGIDLACRLGGEEFVILMPDTGMERARQVGERVRECIAGEPFQADRGVEVSVTASVGIATLGEHDSFADMFKRADRALYAAKRGGRNRVVAAAA